MIFKVVHKNIFGFDFQAVKRRFTGGVEWIGQVQDDNDQPWALFSVKNPNRALGHKDYMMLCKTHVSGREGDMVVEMAWTNGALCFHCLTYVYSAAHHDMAYCECKKIFVDGGKGPYGRYGGSDLAFMDYNLITREFRYRSGKWIIR